MATPYGFGTTSIGKMTIDNPMRLEKTATNPMAALLNQTGGADTNRLAPYSAPSGGGGGGSNNTLTPEAPPVDPYAAWGGTAKYNSLVSGFDTQKQNIFGTADEAAGAAGNKLHLSILDFLDSARQGQKNVDLKGAQNELAKQQGMSGILGMVGRGIKSGGVTLANRNAGDSSAAGAIANAYGQLGRQQAANVGNQYEMGNMEVGNMQDAQNTQMQSGVRNLQGSKIDAVNNIVADARNQFASLDAQIANANLPQRIAIEQEKEKVRASALSALQQYDAELNQGTAGIHASTPEQRRAQAAQMASAGTSLGANAFNYTDEAPMQFQNTGPFASDLPLFSTLGKKRA